MRQLFGVVALVALSACGARGAIETNPTADQAQAVRQFAVRVTDATSAGLTIANQTGVILATLPVDAKTKDTFDCAILKVTGTSQPASETVTKVCGPVSLVANAPLAQALVTLKTVTVCPNLRTTVTAILTAVNPLIVMLESSTQAALKMAGLSLRATFALLSSGGSQCLG